MRIMQGDSYPIQIEITQDGRTVTPEMVEEIEITVGTALTKKLTDGAVFYENGMWYIWPSQSETLAMSGTYTVIGRVKYPNNPAPVVGTRAGILIVTETNSKEVL